MFQKIVVPLDGSARAEAAIPVAARITRSTGASLLLIRIIYPHLAYTRYTRVLAIPDELNSDMTEEEITQASNYLQQIALPESLTLNLR